MIEKMQEIIALEEVHAFRPLLRPMQQLKVSRAPLIETKQHKVLVEEVWPRSFAQELQLQKKGGKHL